MRNIIYVHNIVELSEMAIERERNIYIFINKYKLLYYPSLFDLNLRLICCFARWRWKEAAARRQNLREAPMAWGGDLLSSGECDEEEEIYFFNIYDANII